MSAHNILHTMFRAPYAMTDPGAGGTITVDRQLASVPVVTATAEARTLAQPTKAGLLCAIGLKTDGGDLTLTVTGGWNAAADTTMTLGDAGDWVVFHSVDVGGSYYWRVLGAEGVAEYIAEDIDIHALTALGAAPDVADLLGVSDESATSDPTRSVTVTQLMTAAGDLTDLAAAPAADDRLLVTDESVAGDPAKSMTVQNLFDGIANLTAFSGAVVPATDQVYIDDAGTVKKCTYQVLMDGINDLTAMSGALVPGTDTVLYDDGGTAKKCTVQVLMDGIGDLTAEVIATTDTIPFIDAGDGAAKIESVDDLFGIGPALTTEAAVDVSADYVLFLDGGASGAAKKEAIADLVTAMAGTAGNSVLTATSGVLEVDVHAATEAAIAAGDYLLFSDESEAGDPSRRESIDDVATLMAGGGLTAASAVLSICSQTWAMAIPGTWEVAGDGKSGNLCGCDQTLDITATEAAAAYAVVYDASDTYYPLSTSATAVGYAANYQLFPDTEAENDAAFFGASLPFCQIWLDVDTVATYNGAAASQIWEYSQGSSTWATLTLKLDGTDVGGAAIGQQPFGSDGPIVFVPPADWAADTVNGQSAYWIRCRCTAAVDITQIPTLDSHEHYVCTPTDGFKAPANANITGIRVCDNGSTAHTSTDVKFFLMNFTKGTSSDELTFPQDKRVDRFDGTSMKTGTGVVAVDDGDILGVVITQEDGTNEVTNAIVEIEVTPL